MKKEKIKDNTIIICLIIIICLLLLLISLVLIKGKVKYKYYDDDLISVNNSTNFKVQTNILDNNTLILLLTSNNDKTSNINVDVDFADEKGEKIDTQTVNGQVYAKNSSIFVFQVPNLKKDEYAGKIKINIKKDGEYKNEIDISKIKCTINDKVDGENVLSVNAKCTNNDEPISYLGGDFVVFKGNDIVDIQYFSHENVLVGSTVTSNVTFISNAGLESFDYDKIDVYITHIDGNLQ